MNEIDLYQAIKEMREISEKNGEFSFAFMSLDENRQKSEGIIQVPRARLRHAMKDEPGSISDYMLFYLDLNTNSPRKCYQMLLMFFNGKKIKLN